MPRKYPPLTPAQVRDILQRHGFALRGTEGSHEQWVHDSVNGKPRHVTVDSGYREFDDDRIKTMIAQSGLSREEFYGVTKAGRKRLNLRWRRPKNS